MREFKPRDNLHLYGKKNNLPNTIQYNTIQYNTIQYNTKQYNTIQLYKEMNRLKVLKQCLRSLYVLQKNPCYIPTMSHSRFQWLTPSLPKLKTAHLNKSTFVVFNYSLFSSLPFGGVWPRRKTVIGCWWPGEREKSIFAPISPSRWIRSWVAEATTHSRHLFCEHFSLLSTRRGSTGCQSVAALGSLFFRIASAERGLLSFCLAIKSSLL